MPEETNSGQPENREPKGLPEVRAALERETERRKALEAEVAEANTAKRELALMRAGVDLDNPVGKLFAKAYDGELDPEAIKTQWTALAPQAPAEPPGEGEPPGTAGQGATPPEPPPPDPQTRLAGARAGLQSEANPPGSEPQAHLGQAMMDAAFHAQQGQRARPAGGFGPKARDAAFDVMFGRATQGDPETVFKRPDETWADATERWRQSQ